MKEKAAGLGLGFIILSVVLAGGYVGISMLVTLWGSQLPIVAKLVLSMLGFSLIVALGLMVIPGTRGGYDGADF